jgi:DNA-directed RNA polymerase specialized sigma subunit
LKEEVRQNKKFLSRYRRYMQRVEKLENKLFQIDCDLQGLKTKNITDMPRGGQPLTTDDLLAKKEELEHRINNLVLKSKKIKFEIFDCIDSLEDDRFAEVLECYFIDRMSLEDIADRKSYSLRHVGYLYAKGIEKVDFEFCKNVRKT